MSSTNYKSLYENSVRKYEETLYGNEVSLRERIAMAVNISPFGWNKEAADAIFEWINGTRETKKPRKTKKPKRRMTILEGLAKAPIKRPYVKRAAYWKPKKKKK